MKLVVRRHEWESEEPQNHCGHFVNSELLALTIPSHSALSFSSLLRIEQFSQCNNNNTAIVMLLRHYLPVSFLASVTFKSHGVKIGIKQILNINNLYIKS